MRRIWLSRASSPPRLAICPAPIFLSRAQYGYWQKDSELTDVYIDHMSYVYTKGIWGKKVPGLYEQNIKVPKH